MRTAIIITIITILLSTALMACKNNGANTNPSSGGINIKTISQGSINSLTSLRDSFQILGKKSEVDALNKILVIANPINAEIQSGDTKSIRQQIEDYARIGSSIAQTVGLSPDIVIAINLGIGVFESLVPILFPNGSATTASPVPAAQTAIDPRTRLGQLQGLDSKYKRQAGR